MDKPILMCSRPQSCGHFCCCIECVEYNENKCGGCDEMDNYELMAECPDSFYADEK